MSVSMRADGLSREVVTIDIECPTLCVKRGSKATVVVNLTGPSTRTILSSSSDPGLLVDVSPSAGVVPFTALVTVHVSPVAELGIHSVMIVALDREKKVTLATAILKVFVVNDKLSNIAEKIDEYRLLYEQKGAQYTLLKILWDWSRTTFTFTELKAIYEMLAMRDLSKGTIYEVLKRMLRKGLIIHESDEYEFNSKITLREAIRAIDIKRSLNGKRGALFTQQRTANEVSIDSLKMPAGIKKLLEKASQLARENYWKAVDLLAHTLVGIRKTGSWFLWSNDYFIYREEKTGLFHYFKSYRLSELLRELGFEEGFMFKHIKHPARDVIHEFYWSYPNARRLHYLLKQQGWFEYPDAILMLEFHYSADKLAYILIRDLNTNSVVWEYRSRPERAERIERFLVIPGEHIDKKNEETYFYRPAGIL